VPLAVLGAAAVGLSDSSLVPSRVDMLLLFASANSLFGIGGIASSLRGSDNEPNRHARNEGDHKEAATVAIAAILVATLPLGAYLISPHFRYHKNSP
jgi:hypothetical protein